MKMMMKTSMKGKANPYAHNHKYKIQALKAEMKQELYLVAKLQFASQAELS